ncbi:MAG TPA: class I SAM-dependent methyltransferase [Pyrinomonadaceae bacterium]
MNSENALPARRPGESLRAVARAFAPRGVRALYLRLKMSRHARRLVALRDASEDPRVWIDELLGSYFFHPLQKRTEILRLTELVRELRPGAVCEIGAAGGGTAFLFAHAAADDATIVSVDLEFGHSRRKVVGRFARARQKLVCVQGDSHEEGTVAAVRASLGKHPLDLLYLDGDHGFEGVAADFRLYTPLMRPGGLVVLHDIVPDFRTRYGVETSSDTGGVPCFWEQVKRAGAEVMEIIEDDAQDGYGIGVLRWPAGGLVLD